MGADGSCANVVHLPSSARIGLASGWLRLCRIASSNDIPGKRSSFIILCLAPIDSNLSPTVAAPHRRQQMACPPLYPPPYSFNLPYERSMGDPLGRASASQRHGPTSKLQPPSHKYPHAFSCPPLLIASFLVSLSTTSSDSPPALLHPFVPCRVSLLFNLLFAPTASPQFFLPSRLHWPWTIIKSSSTMALTRCKETMDAHIKIAT